MRRWWLLLVPLSFIAVMALAHHLTPNASGMGTHQQLGLPPCFFLKLTGWRCPACGLTTSFAWAARGQLGESFRAHPFGPVLVLLFAWVSLISLLEFLEIGGALRGVHRKYWVNASVAGSLLFVAVWILRVAHQFLAKG